MKALLLAAGLGTRLKPITDHTPKCLVPIRQKPLLAYWLDLLLPQHVEEVLINTHYLSPLVNDFVAASPWRESITLVHETELLGTAGTVLKNRDFLADDAFLLAHADNLTRFDMQAFADAHAKRKAEVVITMMTFRTDVPHACGIVETDDEGLVVAFYEKSREFHGNFANAAVYIVEPSVIDFIALLGKDIVDMSTEVLPHYLGRIQVYHNDDYHRDIGTPESLQLAEKEY